MQLNKLALSSSPPTLQFYYSAGTSTKNPPTPIGMIEVHSNDVDSVRDMQLTGDSIIQG